MSSAIFYRTALDRKLSDGTRQLFETLLVRNEQIERILDGVGINPMEDSDVGDSDDGDGSTRGKIRAMEGMVKTYVTLISSESLLLQTAMESEQSALRHERDLAKSANPEEVEFGRPLIELREANVQDIQKFRSGL